MSIEKVAKQAERRWRDVTSDITNPRTRMVTQVLLETQYRDIERQKRLNEDTLSGNVGSFTSFVLPALRRTVPNLIAMKLVSVQPMTGPIGAIQFRESVYQSTKGTISAGQNFLQTFGTNYSSEFIDYELRVASADVDGVKSTWNNGTNAADRIGFAWLPVHPYSEAKGYALKIFWTSGGTLHTAIDNGSGTLMEGSSSRGTVTYVTGEFTLTLAGVVPDAATPIYSTYFFDSEKIDQTRSAGEVGVGSATYNAATSQASMVPEIGSDISLIEIKARTRKLRARFSIESIEDLKALQGADAEVEVVTDFSDHMTLEIDREVIDDLIIGSRWSATWTLSSAFAGASVHTELDSIRHLITIIDAVSAKIHIASHRAPANFLVVPPAVSTLLNQLSSHGDYMMVNRLVDIERVATFGPAQADYGVMLVGVLGSRYSVYVDPFMASDKILVGLVGKNYLDAGYAHCPYIGVQVSDTFIDPDTWVARKGMRTRYAKRMLRPEFYGVVTVAGLPEVA